MVEYPVVSPCSFRNFRSDERKLLGWAKYSLCFIDTVMLVHFLSATGAFLEAKHIYENTPQDQLRLFISLSLATTYAAVFLAFFLTYCCVKDTITLIRIRLCLLLASGFANFTFLLSIASLLAYFRRVDHFINELAVDPNKKTDIAWIAVLVIAATAVVISMLAGVLALSFFKKFEKLDNLELFNSNSYVSFSPESPYASYWKPSRKFPTSRSHRLEGLHSYYPHRAISGPTPKKVSQRDSALMQELKSDLCHRNDSKRTVL